MTEATRKFLGDLYFYIGVVCLVLLLIFGSIGCAMTLDNRYMQRAIDGCYTAGGVPELYEDSTSRRFTCRRNGT